MSNVLRLYPPRSCRSFFCLKKFHLLLMAGSIHAGLRRAVYATVNVNENKSSASSSANL